MKKFYVLTDFRAIYRVKAMTKKQLKAARDRAANTGRAWYSVHEIPLERLADLSEKQLNPSTGEEHGDDQG